MPISKYIYIIFYKLKFCLFTAWNITVTEHPVVDSLLTFLQKLPGTQACFARSPSGRAGEASYPFDATISLALGEARITLLVEAKKALYPRDVREALWNIRRYSSDDVVPVLAAESLSPGAKELMRGEKVGYYDAGGSLFVPAKHAYLYIDRPPSKPMAKAIRTLFSGRRSQVLHALLVHRQRWFSVKDMAHEALVSPPTASQTLKELERFDWLRSRGKGPNKERQLVEPAALLDEWARRQSLAGISPVRRYYASAMKGERLAGELARLCEEHGVEYTLTSEAAAQRYAPYLSEIRQIRVRLAAGEATESVLARLNARPVAEGANLFVVDAKSRGDFLFKEQVDGLWLASPIQVYLDLLGGEGRAKDMAEHLRHERIGV